MILIKPCGEEKTVAEWRISGYRFGLDTLMLMGGACAVALLCKRRK